ncbi:hypothetical protein BH24DEI1_BH24DEI1_16970 [soil metagenome]|jgi:MerR family transcriptional regulator/heat shock protein HspR|nr:helix-turn-helix transcriptional regulator [Deinococcota bacterium]
MTKGAKESQGTEGGLAAGNGDAKGRDVRDLDAKDRPLYVISVAAELVDMHPQTLRLYERKGLIEPQRSSGKTRLYSERNIEQLREIRRLTQELGVNLAGVEEIIRLRRSLDTLQDQMEGRISFLQSRLSDRLLKLSAALDAPADEGADEARVSGEG